MCKSGKNINFLWIKSAWIDKAQAYGYTEKSSVFKERLGFYPMNWLNKLERKIGRYAVPNLIIWLIGAYTIGYVFGTVSPGILSYLTLSPYHILHGQIWRLVTWVFMGRQSGNLYVPAQFYHFLLFNAEFQTLFAAWNTQETAVQVPDASTQTGFRHYQAQMCDLWQDRTWWSEFRVPFLFKVWRQLWILSGSSVYT